MDPGEPGADRVGAATPLFATTHWSVVLAGGEVWSWQAAAALEPLRRNFWYPLCICVRGAGHSPEEAQDLTQEFFARLIGKHYLTAVHPERGRLRWFLLCAVKPFLLNERDRAAAVKRGGTKPHVAFDGEKAGERYRLDAANPDSPDRLFDRAWATHLIESTYRPLEEEYALEGKERLFQPLRGRHATFGAGV